jgi:hypothetical protein
MPAPCLPLRDRHPPGGEIRQRIPDLILNRRKNLVARRLGQMRHDNLQHPRRYRLQKRLPHLDPQILQRHDHRRRLQIITTRNRRR